MILIFSQPALSLATRDFDPSKQVLLCIKAFKMEILCSIMCTTQVSFHMICSKKKIGDIGVYITVIKFQQRKVTLRAMAYFSERYYYYIVYTSYKSHSNELPYVHRCEVYQVCCTHANFYYSVFKISSPPPTFISSILPT